MALPVTDTFSGTAGQDLTAYSSSWTAAMPTSANQFECDGSGNARVAIASVESGNFWNADTFNDDQYAEITADFEATTDNYPMGVLVRASAGGNGYGCYAGATTLWIFELNGGTWTGLGATVAVSLGSGDHTIRMTATGSLLTVYVDGVAVATRTDTTHTSGAAGIFGFSATSPSPQLVRSWTAGNTGYPVIEGVTESNLTSAGTSHSVTLPASIASTDLVLIIMAIGSTSANIVPDSGDWSEVLDDVAAFGLKILRFTGAGVPTSPATFTSSAATKSASIAYRISGADESVTPQIGTTSSGTSATPDPPSVTPTGGTSKDYLFITFFGAGGEEADDDTWANTPPTNYLPSPPRQKACGTAGTNLGGKIASAERQLTTGSAENPGTFNQDVSTDWRAQTIIVHPAPTDFGGTATPAVISASFTLPAATASGPVDGTATPAVLATAAALPAAGPKAGTVTTPAAISTAAALPAVTPQAGTVKTPAAISTPVTLPAASPKAGTVTAPAVISTAAALPAVTPRAGGDTSPAAISTVATLPAASASGAAAGTATPAVIATAATLPAPTAQAGATVAPAAISTIFEFAVTTSVDQTVSIDAPIVVPIVPQAPTATGGGSATATPAVIAAAATLPAVTPAAGSTTAPAVIATAATLPAPITKAGSAATPAALTVTVTIPQVAASGGGSATAAPAQIAVPVTLPAVTKSAGSTTTPAAIPTTVNLPAATPLAGSRATPAVIPVTVTVPAASASGAAAGTATPTVITIPVTVPAASVSGSTVVTPAVLPIAFTLPSAVGSGSKTVLPASIPLLVSQSAVGVSAGATASPAAVSLTVALPQLTLLFGNTVTPAAIVVAVALGAVIASGTPPDQNPHTVTLRTGASGVTLEGAAATVRLRIANNIVILEQ